MGNREILITADNTRIEAELNDSAAAGLIFEKLPLEAFVSKWGEEIYFTLPVKTDMRNPVETVEEGDIAYWPGGPAFCIFFGQTPISSGGKIIPAGPVELIGRVSSELELLREIPAGSGITVAKRGE